MFHYKKHLIVKEHVAGTPAKYLVNIGYKAYSFTSLRDAMLAIDWKHILYG